MTWVAGICEDDEPGCTNIGLDCADWSPSEKIDSNGCRVWIAFGSTPKVAIQRVKQFRSECLTGENRE